MISKNELLLNAKQSASPTELNIYNTVELIDAFFETIPDIKTFKTQYSTAVFKELDKLGKRSWGMFFYVKFQLQEALPKSQNTEQSLIHELIQLLEEIYRGGKNGPIEKMDALFNKVNQLLDLYPNDTTNVEQAQKLCLSIYFMLSILKTTFDNMGMANTVILKGLGIKKEELASKLDGLISKVERKNSELATKKSHQGTNRLNGFLAAKHDNALTKCSVTDIAPLITATDEIERQLSVVIGHRDKITKLQKEADLVHSLLNAIEENNTKTIGRKYLIELISEHDEAYEMLLAEAETPEKTQLVANIIALSNPDFVNQALVAWNTSTEWLTAAYRAFTPSVVQNYISESLPDTLDSDSKKALKVLCENCLTQRKDALEVEKKSLNQASGVLFPELKSDPDSQIANPEELLLRNNLVKRVALVYKELSVLRSDVLALEQFRQQNNTVLVKLSLLFSKLSPLFETDTAKMIVQTRQMLTDLEQLEKTYKSSVDALDKSNEHIAHIEEAVTSNVTEKRVVTKDTVNSIFKRRLQEGRQDSSEEENTPAPGAGG